MKKIILLFFGLFACFQSFGQDPDLYGTWYLTSYNYGSGGVNYIKDIQPRISPNIQIDANIEISGEAACSLYIGQFDYDAIEDELIVDFFDSTLTLCDYESHNIFEVDYFSYFSSEKRFKYEVLKNPSSNESQLTLFGAPGFDLVYQNFPLNNSTNEKNVFNVFPNPVSDRLVIFSEGLTSKKIIRIFSITGQQITQVETFENTVDVAFLSRGMYMLEIETSEGRSVQKFIKK